MLSAAQQHNIQLVQRSDDKSPTQIIKTDIKRKF